MVLIKRMLMGIVALVVLFLVVGFLLPREVRVISAPAERPMRTT